MSILSNLNNSLFLFMNAPESPNYLVLFMATFLAEYLILLIPISFVATWLFGSEELRKVIMISFFAICGALLINQLISLIYYHPRPFVIDLGTNLLKHAPDSSFPSDHLTIIWCLAFYFISQKKFNKIGIIIFFIGFSVAWARIYLGVHYPLDMLGALVVGKIAAMIYVKLINKHIDWLYKKLHKIYYLLFSSFIKKGWINE